MTLARLMIRNTVRRPVRLALTIGGLAMVVLAFGLIRLTLDEWQAAARAAVKNRLIAVHAMSEMLTLPLAYKDRIAVIPGVQTVHYGNWFGGLYRDAKQSFGTFAENSATLFTMYPEIIISEQERLAFLGDRRSGIVGEKLAARFGWKVGDVIPLKGTAYPGDWEVVVRGTYGSTNPKIFSDQELYLHWAYANERLRTDAPDRVDQVGWYTVRTTSDSNVDTIAAAIDASFANSIAETRTQSEQAFIAGWVARSGALMQGLGWLSGVINSIAVLVLVNVLAMTIRERTREYGVMKTLGFQPCHLIALILGESILVSFAGAGAGLGLLYPAAQIYSAMTSTKEQVISYQIDAATVGWCLAMMMAVGLVAAIWPALRLIRMTTLDGLRHRG